MKKFKVGVFTHQGKRSRQHRAYTVWYSPQWEGCCEHIVFAENGSVAKKLAITEHQVKCKAISAGP